MPVNLSIKAVPDAIAQRLRTRAANNHRSLQRELMAIIETAATTPEAFSANTDTSVGRQRRQTTKRPRPIEEISKELRTLFPHATGGPSSTEIIRAMRDSRYGVPLDQPSKRTRRR